MKKIFLTTFLYTTHLILLSQTDSTYQGNFNWQIIDSTNKSKKDLYMEFKNYVINSYLNPNLITVIDDKEAGLIAIKPNKTFKLPYSVSSYDYTYSYTLNFQFNDNSYKITLGNFNCINTMYYPNPSISPLKIQPFEGDNFPKLNQFGYCSMSEKKAIELMNMIKQFSYELIIKLNLQLKNESTISK